MAAVIVPPGSTRSSGVNHHGTPFCRLTTHVSAPSRHPRRGANCGRLCAFTAKKTTSAGPMDSRSPVALGRASKSPSGLITRTPRSSIARNCGPRANSVTSRPARAIAAPMYTPTAPAQPWVLARGGGGNGSHNVDLLGTFKTRQPAAAEADQIGLARRRFGTEHHRRLHLLAPGGMRHAEADSFGYRGMRQQHFVDFTRRDILASPDNRSEERRVGEECRSRRAAA